MEAVLNRQGVALPGDAMVAPELPSGAERVNIFPTHRRRFLCNNLGQLGADRCW